MKRLFDLSPLAIASLLYLLIACVSVIIYLAVIPFEQDIAGNILQDFCRLDCSRYLDMASNGYPRESNSTGDMNWAFFYLYPLLIRAVVEVTTLSYLASGMLVSSLANFGLCVILIKHCASIGLTRQQAAIVLLLYFLGPYALHSQIVYSEGVFNFVLLATILAWRKENYVLAGICGALVCSTRLNGVFLPIALAVVTIFETRGRVLLFTSDEFATHFPKVCAIAIMPLGFVVHSFYFATLTGDPLTSMHTIQTGWRKIFRNPFVVLYQGLFGNSAFHFVLHALQVLLFLFVIGVMVRKMKHYVLGVFLFLVMLAPLSTSLVSIPRYTFGVFPSHLPVILLNRWIIAALFPLLLALKYLSFLAWI